LGQPTDQPPGAAPAHQRRCHPAEPTGTLPGSRSRAKPLSPPPPEPPPGHHHPLQIIEQWDQDLLRRSAEHLEAGLKGLTADTSNETRALGRQGCVAYVAKLPDRGELLLRKLDPSLREKLAAMAPHGAKAPPAAGRLDGRGGA
jgi:hypothetical protein